MPPLVIPNTIQVTLRHDLTQTNQSVNVLHFRYPGAAPGNVDLENLISDLHDWWDGTLDPVSPKANMNVSTVLREITATDIGSVGGAQATTPFNDAGAVAGDRLPTQLALVTTWRTAVRGPRARGRTYWTGFSEGTNDATGTPSSAIIAAVLNYSNDLITLNPGGYQLAVASRTDLVSRVVTSCVVDGRWDIQRRRAD